MKESIIVAIDGRCAAGKSTLSRELAKKYDCNVFHMDDFFLRPEQRSAERLSHPGENIDHERFLEEILLPLCEGREVYFRRYDCQKEQLGDTFRMPKKKMNIIEGVYCFHPSLIKYYDYKIFYDIDKELQIERILHRNTPEMAQRFFAEWIPLEEKYFEELKIREKADYILRSK